MTDFERRIGNPFFRCAGPNCGLVKGVNNRWWVMWTSYGERDAPIMHLAPWDETLIVQEGALPVCGEGCAQKLQSQFMGNLRENEERRRA
jgi:hypothetical protein